MLPIGFGRAICGDLAQAERREWWITNGRGGYAAGTIAGSLTRTYHGLLIAPIAGPLGRVLLLAKADARLEIGDVSWPLCTNRWGSGTVDPNGYVHLEHFALDHTIPTWRFAFGEHVVEQAIWMEQGQNTTCVAWRLRAGGPASLAVRLLANRRDHHGGETTIAGLSYPSGQILVHGASGPDLRIDAPGATISPCGDWFEDFHLSIETERGLHDRDRHLCVGTLKYALTPDTWMGLVASSEPAADLDLPASLARRRAHDRAVVARAQAAVPALADAPGWVLRLVLAADAFLFERSQGPSIIAGYPWFNDWGRDSMIALPGLTLATGQPDRARAILRNFTGFLDRGLLPNVFPGDGAIAEYNTADATLWFFEAWNLYLQATGDLDAIRDVLPKLQEVIEWHVRGTRYGIGVDPADGLLAAGVPGVQLTWMDAKLGDHVVTPRHGKPVEINALWYNALCVMAEFCERLSVDPTAYRARAAQALAAFQRFVRTDGAGLRDVLDPEDTAFRPNQIFAVSLTHSPLDRSTQRDVVSLVAGKFLCSFGLRSLAAEDPAYCPVYAGGPTARDGAYHQGTVWAWLLGPFAQAHARAFGDVTAARAWLEPISDHLLDAGLGTVGEIFDGAAPHHPRGCPAQAWSVATVLQAWCRMEGE